VHFSLRANPDLLYRTRILIWLLLLFVVITTLAGLLLTLIPLARPNRILGLGMCATTFLGASTLLLRLHRMGDYRLCSTATWLLIQLAVFIGIVLAGGILQAPSTQLLIMSPLVAYFFGGVRGGNQSLVLSLFLVTALLTAKWIGIGFPQSIDTTHDLGISYLLASFFQLLLVSAMAFVYEFTDSKLKSERDHKRRKLQILARQDVLTGLPNRRSLEASLSERIAVSAGGDQPPRPFALCCIDLDGFKPINDRFGHKVGDEVLRAIGKRLRQFVRGNDVIGRLGGDEFTAIFGTDGCLLTEDRTGVEKLAERLLLLINQPVDTSVGALHVSASLGFAFYSHDGRDAESLKKAADNAMYEAKYAGGGGWRLLPPSAHPEKTVEPGKPISVADAPIGADFTGSAAVAADSHKVRSRVITFLDVFLHPALRTESTVVNRARILAATLLLVCLLLVATAAAMAMMPRYANKVTTVAIALAVFAVTALLLRLLQRRGNYVLCSATTLISLYLTMVAAICVTGGPTASITQMISVFPLIAYFFGGARWGNGMVAASLITIAVFTLLEIHGFHFYTLFDDATLTVSRVLNCIFGLAFTSGVALAYVLIARNLERERDLEQQSIERLAKTDVLTGLANRMSFDAELSIRLARANTGEPSPVFALCYLDLDGFKPINDRYGHDVGDDVLRAISERLTSCVREGDLVGRHGGDEFILLLNSVNNEAEMELVARRLLRAIAPPIQTRAGMLSVKGSLGFAMFPVDGDSEDALKSAADKAMYQAKAQGSGWRPCEPSGSRTVRV
jgi:diguanylate cyclase (GGDEF)-like protein